MINKYEQDKKDFLEARKVLIEKYGRDYMSALAKLNARNIYDEDGYLDSEYVLSDSEKQALMKFNPELTSTFKRPSQEEEILSDYTKKDVNNGKKINDDYLKLLLEVIKTTVKISANPNREIKDVCYQITGINSMSDEIIRKYGEDVYYLAIRNSDLVCLMQDDKVVTPVISLKSFMKILSEVKNIPSYIDHSNNTFHYNAMMEFKK